MVGPDAFVAARELIAAARDAGAFPAAVIDVGGEGGSLWSEAFGRLTYGADAAPTTVDTWFDLASLTKVIATVPVAMRQLQMGRLSLDAAATTWLPDWLPIARGDFTVRQLLDHSSGLPGYAPLWEQARGRTALVHAIANLPLAYDRGTQSVYSDVGFILLGFALETAGHAPLDRQFDDLGLGLGDVAFTPDVSLRPRIAPTEIKPGRGLVHGEVHDENATALGGVAGHAGLFGTAASVAAYARLVLRTMRETTPLATPALMQTFTTRTAVPGSSRALGWDTMLPTSSCGTRMSPTSIGHTGFTGTSLWIDLERGIYVVFLTNRVHPTRANEQLRALRPRLHDAVIEGL